MPRAAMVLPKPPIGASDSGRCQRTRRRCPARLRGEVRSRASQEPARAGRGDQGRPDHARPEVRAAIEESVRRARAVAANQVPKDFYTDLAEGARVPNAGFRFSASACMCPAARRLPELRHHERCAGPGAGVESLAIATPPARTMRKACRTRPSSPPAPSSVLTRYTRSAALRPLPCSHTAPRAASRRTATSCAIRLTRSPAGQHLRGHRQVAGLRIRGH